MKNLAPIALFAYNRPEHTRNTLAALRANPLASESQLFIFQDAPKDPNNGEAIQKWKELKALFSDVRGFANVQLIEREKNLGLARSIISGVNHVLQQHDRIIVLEDDIATTPDFLSYMNQALEKYSASPEVFSVTGFNFPILISHDYSYDAYFSYRCNSWGWGTWKDRWLKTDWEVSDYSKFRRDFRARRKFNLGGNDLSPMLDDQMQGKIDSWAIRWGYAHFKNNAYCLFPTQSKVVNTGLDGSGTHCVEVASQSINQALTSKPVFHYKLPEEVKIDREIARSFAQFNSIPLRRAFKHTVTDLLTWLFN